MKSIIIGFSVLAILSLNSCKKSYQCDCSQSKSVSYKENSREKAIAACKAKTQVSKGEECRIVN